MIILVILSYYIIYYRKIWDVYKSGRNDDDSDSDLACWNAVFVFNRVILCCLLFLIVLVTAVLSKLTFVLMTSQIYPPMGANYSLKTLHDKLHYRLNNTELLQKTEVFWIWAVLMAVSTPYLFTFIKCLWRLLFKRTKAFKCSILIAVSSENFFSDYFTKNVNMLQYSVLSCLWRL